MFFMCFIMPIHLKKKIICNLILIFGLSISSSQNKGTFNLDPTLQSLMLPGWGQSTLGFKGRSNTFFYTESVILISILATNKFSNEIKRNYIAFASSHAFVTSNGKDREFWVDIGNYNSIEDYNDEHLRNRETDDLYPLNSEWSWKWDSDENRRHFESRRIQSDRFKLASTFAVGALALNHIISSIDALYLKRKSKLNKLSFSSYQNDVNEIGYKIDYIF